MNGQTHDWRIVRENLHADGLLQAQRCHRCDLDAAGRTALGPDDAPRAVAARLPAGAETTPTTSNDHRREERRIRRDIARQARPPAGSRDPAGCSRDDHRRHAGTHAHGTHSAPRHHPENHRNSPVPQRRRHYHRSAGGLAMVVLAPTTTLTPTSRRRITTEHNKEKSGQRG